MPAKISREELLAQLHRLANELGKTPTRTEMNDHGKYSRSPYDTEFGGWNKALEAAGLKKNKAVELGRDELLTELQRVATELGKSPTQAEFRETSQYTERAYKSTFGSWNAALRAAGLEVNKPHGTDVTKECPECGSTFEVKPSEKAKRQYCSLSCLGKSKTGERNPHPNAGNRATLECEWCGSEYEVTLYKEDKSRFCSRECLGRHHKEVRSGEDAPRWNGGAIEWRGPDWDKQREKVLKRDLYECVECGFGQQQHQDEYGQELNVHHIREFASFNGDYESANNLENLVTLCKECHSLFEHLGIDEQRKMLPFSW